MPSQLFLSLIDEEKCYQLLRQIRWPEGVQCLNCQKKEFTQEYDELPKRKYRCKTCGRAFNDLTGTIFQYTKLPLKYWFYAYEQFRKGATALAVAQELQISRFTTARMRERLQKCLCAKKETLPLEGVVEVDEMYVNAGAKGEKDTSDDENSGDSQDSGRGRGQKRRGRGTADSGRPPVFGAVERGSGRSQTEVHARATQSDCHGFVEDHVAKGATVMTDEWRGYNDLEGLGYDHRQVSHGAGEYAREDPETDVVTHVNTAESLWSVARPWLRSFRGVRQDRLDEYLAFFDCVRELKRRSLDVLRVLLELTLRPDKTWTSEFPEAAVENA